MKMNDIREEYGAEFIEYLTDEFAKPLDDSNPIFPRRDLLDEIKKVRAHNYEPLYLEMLFAMYKMFLKKHEEVFRAHQDAAELTALELKIYEKHVDLLEGMVGYLERQPMEKAKKAKAAQDAKWEPVRQFAFDLAVKGNYPSRNQAVLAIKKQVLDKASSVGLSMSSQRAEKTIDGWLAERGYTPPASKRGTSASKRNTSAS